MKAIRSVPLPSNRPLPHLWGVEPASSVNTDQTNLNTGVSRVHADRWWCSADAVKQHAIWIAQSEAAPPDEQPTTQEPGNRAGLRSFQVPLARDFDSPYRPQIKRRPSRIPLRS
jgi:hypothetical protein